MKITKTVDVPNRKALRHWLKKHSTIEREIWLVYYRKQAGKRRIAYSYAVEEARWFGWIDSVAKAVDAGRFGQKFSHRNPTSGYS